MFLSEWREFLSALCLVEGGGRDFTTARISMFLKSHASLKYFRACFIPSRAKDLSAPRVGNTPKNVPMRSIIIYLSITFTKPTTVKIVW